MLFLNVEDPFTTLYSAHETQNEVKNETQNEVKNHVNEGTQINAQETLMMYAEAVANVRFTDIAPTTVRALQGPASIACNAFFKD